MAAICKQISGVLCALVVGAGAWAQTNSEPSDPASNPTTQGSGSTNSSGSQVGPNVTPVSVDFLDPRRSGATDDATAAVGGVTIDFDNLGIDPSTLGGQNGLPTDLTQYELDPDALSDALGNSDLSDLVSGAFDNDVGGGAFDDWVNSVMGGNTDPFETTGLSPSTPPSSCVETPTSRERVNRTRYSCSVDDGTSAGQPTCEQVLVHPTDDDYIYECGETRPSPSDEWAGQCAQFEDEPGCEQTDEVCNQEVSAVPADYSCESGQSVDYTTEQCQEQREYVLDPDYDYQCTREWVGGQWVYSPECAAIEDSGLCEGTGSVCQTPAEPVETDYACETTWGAAASEESCVGTLEIELDADYTYNCSQVWDEQSSSWVDQDPALCADLRTQCVRIEDWPCDQPGSPNLQDRFCDVGHVLVDQPETCDQGRLHEVDLDFRYEAIEVFDTADREWDQLVQQIALVDSGLCSQTGSECLESREFPRVTQSCRIGFALGSEDRTCLLPLEHAVDVDYVYGCERRWNPATETFETSPECTRLSGTASCDWQSETCTTAAPPVFEEYSCRVGDIRVPRDESLDRALRVVVDPDYVYRCYREWNDGSSSFVDDNACQVLDANATCEQVAMSCVTDSPGVFSTTSCDRGYRINQSQQTCAAPAVVQVDVDYSYDATRSWNGTSFEPSFENARLQQYNCALTSSRCTTPSPGVFTRHSCQQGYRDNPEQRSCDRPRVITVDADYEYRAANNWTGSAWAATSQLNTLRGRSDCTETSSVCVTPSPGVFTYHDCRTGYRDNPEQRSCDRPRVITVDADYVYEGHRNWNGSAFVNDSARNSLGSNSSCSQTGSVCSTPSPGVFTRHTCQQGYRDNPQARSCERPAVVTIDIDPVYTGLRTWNGSQFVNNASLTTLQGAANCSQTSATCTTPSPGVYSYHSCQSGWRYNTETRSCTRPLNVSVDADYEYLGYRNWNGSTHAPNSARTTLGNRSDCSQISSRCSAASPGVYSTYTCQQGTQLGTTNRTCSEVLNVTVQRWYRHTHLYTTSAFEPGLEGNGEAIYTPALGCTAMGAPICQSMGGGGLFGGEGGSRNSCTQYYRCSTQTINGVSGTSLPSTSSDSWDTSSCNQHSSCTQTQRTCVEGAATRTINGVAVYRDCWRYQRTYSCGTSTAVNTCSPPANAQHVRDTCLRMDGSTCGLTQREYRVPQTDPSGGCHQYEDRFRCENAVSGLTAVATPRDQTGSSWDMTECNAARAGTASCSLASTVCVEGAGTRTINGLAVYKSCWRQELRYSCQVRQDINTCSPPSGSSLQTETCAWSDSGGTCRLFNRTYRRQETDPSGGCHEYTHTFRCENNVGGLTQIDDIRTIGSQTWDTSACTAAIAGTVSCSQSGTTCIEGAGTRVINGVSVYRSCWRQRINYSCSVRENINTCSPPSGSTMTAQTCAWTDSAGTCRLYDRTYEREENDPSGGCHQWTDSFRCEGQVSGLSATQTIREVTSDSYDGSSCGPARAGTWSCTLVSNACIQGAGTRTINGLAVYRDCWERRNVYDCTVRETINTCSPPSGSSLIGETCVWSDSAGTCRLFDRQYRREETDPSGGCHSYEHSFMCENPVSGLTASRTVREVTGDSYDGSSCGPARAGTNACTLVSNTCIQGAGTRTINGLAVYRDCWERRNVYDCTVRETINTCSPPTGSTLENEACAWSDAAGTCRLFTRTYVREENDPSGGCHVFTDRFRCENTVGLVGQPVEYHRDIIQNTYDRAACGSLEASSTCERTGRRCVSGPETRTINGLEVYRDCWEEEDIYTCNVRQDINTCPSDDQYGVASGDANENLLRGGDLSRGEDLVAGTRMYSAATGARQMEVLEDGTQALVIRDQGGNQWSSGTIVTSYADLNTGDSAAGYFSVSPGDEIAVGFESRQLGDPLNRVYLYAQFLDANNAFLLNTAAASAISSEWRSVSRVATAPANSAYVRIRLHTFARVGSNGTPNGFDMAIRNLWFKHAPGGFDGAPSYSAPTHGDYEETSRTCVWSDSAGVCRLFRFEYRREETDPSGGCHRYDRRFLCEDYVGGIPLPIDTVRTIVDETLDHATEAAALEQQSCTETGRTCISGPATRTINGLSVTRDCWQWRYSFTCEDRQAYDGCSPAQGCSLASETCVDFNADGSCMLTERTYSCETEDGSGGCHVFTNEYRCENQVANVGPVAREIRTASEGVFNEQACASLEAEVGCVQTSVRCSARAPTTRVVDGVEITSDCWEQERTYSCETRTPLDDCGPMSQCDLVSEVCDATAADGTCATYQRTYSCEIDDGSDRCARRRIDYTCSAPVENGGNPVSAFATSLGTAHWDESCTNGYTANACEIVEETCLAGPGNLTVNMVVSAADLSADPELARVLGLQGVSEGSGHASEIEGAHGLWRITSAMVEAYEASIDCAQRRVVYNCAVPEPVNTCGEYDPAYADDGEGAGSANADPLVVTTINGTGGDDVMSGTDGADNIIAAGGNDVIYGGGNRDRVDAGAGDDYVEMGDGDHYPFQDDAGTWVDRGVYGGAGNDQIVGGPDRIYMRGGDGDDLFVLHPSNRQWSRFDGGNGRDTLSFQRFEAGVTVALDAPYYDPANTGNWHTILGNQHFVNMENLKGSQYADTLTGDDGDNFIYGLGGDDLIDGGLGVDIAVFAGNDSDYVISITGEGEATISGGGQGTDTLTGIEVVYFEGNARAIPLNGVYYGNLVDPRIEPCSFDQGQWSCNIMEDDGDPCARFPTLCQPIVYPVNLPGVPGQPSAPPPAGTMGECVFQDSVCSVTGNDGSCLLERRRYVCEISDGSGGCSERSELWRCETEMPGGQTVEVLYAPGDQSWNWQACDQFEATSRCRPVGQPVCSDNEPASRDIGNSIFVEAACWELTQAYQCDPIEEVSTCDATFTGACADGVTGEQCATDRVCSLVETVCDRVDFNGECLVESYAYTCTSLANPEGCAVAVDDYRCETTVPGAGDPTDVVITIDGSSWVGSDCAAASNNACEAEPTTRCVSDATDPRSLLWRWRDGEDDPILEDRADLASVDFNGCQVRERDYTCASFTDASTCDVPDESCIQVAAECVEYDRDNVCIREAVSYQCTAREAGCIDRTRTFRCDELVDGAGAPSGVETNVGEPYWEERGCEEFDDPDLECTRGAPVCRSGGGTRLIGGQEIYEECWEQDIDFTCDGVDQVRTDCDPPDHCVLEEEVCLDDPQIGACRSLERRYVCEETITETGTEEQCGTEITCFGGTCVETEREQSTGMPDALAQLAALGQAHETEGSTSSTLRLMGGDDLRCHKTGIWKNCCTNGGAGLAIDLLGGQCNEEEQELAHRTSENQCVEIGWYCARRGWFGCRKRERTSCCFGSELARIVNEAGHDQLGLDWGTPRDPNCAGLTPEQFAQVDLSEVDMSALFDDVVEGFAPDGQGSVESRIRDRLSSFYSQGSSGTGAAPSGSGGSQDGGN